MAAQVGLELSAENLQGSTLADTVGSHETENLARAGHGQTVQLEAVRAIAVGHLALEVCWQVDDGDGVEGAFLGADTATNAQRFGDEGELGLGGNLNTELATADDRARFLAFLSTFARATLENTEASVSRVTIFRWWGRRGY